MRANLREHQSTAYVLRQLALGADRDVPLVDIARLVAADAFDRDASRFATQLVARLEGNGSLAAALGTMDGAFPAGTIALLEHGEANRRLAPVLRLLAADIERAGEMRARLGSVLFLPLSSLGFSLLVVALCMIFVIPAFKQVFASFGADLPGPTLLVIAVSDLFVEWWWITLPLIAALFVPRVRRKLGLGAFFESALNRLPITGGALRKVALARLTATLADALRHDVPVALVLRHLADSSGSFTLAGWGRDIAARLDTRRPVEAAVREAAQVPRALAMAVDIGTRTDSLGTVLAEAAAIFDEAASRSAAAMRQLAFYLAYAVVGSVIGMMVFAMYLPIFKLGSVI